MTLQADQWTKDFHKREFTISGAHPELVVQIPNKYVNVMKKLAVEGLQPIRDRLGRTMRILSGYRSYSLNRAVGGSPSSQHVVGQAADFNCDNVYGAVEDIISMIEDKKLQTLGQIIYYPEQNFIHVALQSVTWQYPTVCIHSPSRGLHYKRIAPIHAELHRLVPKHV